jgi:Fanconi anemia group M protein
MAFVSHPWINSDTIESRDYQDNIVKTALTGNTLCVLPTGLGKTSIAALVAAERLSRAFEAKKNKPQEKQDDFVSADKISAVDNSKVLFLAPTRPLVDQHRNSFERFLKIGPDEIIAITGTMKPIDRKRAYQHGDVIIATPQTVRNDIKNRILDLEHFNLLIVDEAHRSVGNYAYVFIAKHYTTAARNPLILALTASPGASRAKIEQIKHALSISNVAIRSREDEDVKPYVQKVDNKWIEVEMPETILAVCGYLDRIRQASTQKLIDLGLQLPPRLSKKYILYLQQSLAKQKHWKSFAAMSILAEILKLDHASLLLETQSLYSFEKYIARLRDDDSKATARLLVNPLFKTALDKIVELSEQGIENPKLERLASIAAAELEKKHQMIIFTQYRDTVDKIVKTMKALPGAQPASFIGQASRTSSKGTVRGMSQKEQADIIKDFKCGSYNILVATSIGEEGLDISETDAVIFYEPIPSEIRSIQRSGRTARTRPGKVIVLIAKGTRDQAFYWSAHHKQKKMADILYGMQEKNPGLEKFVK